MKVGKKNFQFANSILFIFICFLFLQMIRTNKVRNLQELGPKFHEVQS